MKEPEREPPFWLLLFVWFVVFGLWAIQPAVHMIGRFLREVVGLG